MAKVKLIYQKRSFNIKRESNLPFDYSCCRITDMDIPKEMYMNNIEVIKQKKKHWDENLLVLQSNDSKKILMYKIMTILDLEFSGKINIISLK